ncbi:hypothetical protein SRHO_G00203950 [Serrasalmus rhombeus]
MGQEKVVDSFIVTELEVAGLDSDVYCEMPDLFTQHRMPVNVCNIPKQQDLDDWPHLKHVYLPEIEAHVELLIGMNMPRALEPLEVVRSVGDGPFAIKTVLGWTVNGPLGRECCGSPGCPSTVTANRISAVTLDKLWEQQFKMDFPESSQDEELGLSREDSKFLRMASETVTLSNGHYSIALPLKDRDIRMPDNRAIVEQRALSLKRKFIRDKDFHKVYTAFMEDLISRGYAQRVPIKDLERSDDKPEKEWPVNPEYLQELPYEDPEVKVSAAINVLQADGDGPLAHLISRTSSWTRLVRVMGWILRFKTLLLHHRKDKAHFQSASDSTQRKDVHHRVGFCDGFLSLEEIKDAEMQIISFVSGRSMLKKSPASRGERL